jgi:hypothetical protein
MTSEQNLRTTGQIAKDLKVPVNVVDYATRRYNIAEVQRAGIIRLFDGNAVDAIRRAVRRTGRNVAYA